ncbi:hypothetical protein DOY81_011733 [Sarcophaga bullata]|nr:hypothetical protein DOY81_011733 [Sarcophaga bullata]
MAAQEETLNVNAVEDKASEVATGEEKKELLDDEAGEEFSYLQRMNSLPKFIKLK